MIRRLEGGRDVFALDTANTTYCFAIRESGHPEHIYYGARITLAEAADILPLAEKREFEPGNVIAYSKDHPAEVPEDTGLEISAPGHGDLREPFLELCAPDGCRSSDFLYENYVIDDEKPAMCGLPGSYSDEGCEHLCVTLRDGDVVLELHYCVYAECDVITRWARIVNRGEGEVRILRLLSAQLDIPRADLSVTTFRGAWAREMQKHTAALSGGKTVNESRAGCSSSRANPFFMVHEPSATETAGDVYG
ncbi:MAG: alpha-galactosidase, partial [Clostridia bacterium]|nr:alpha-galactosidase [Clostridia bacterium]